VLFCTSRSVDRLVGWWPPRIPSPVTVAPLPPTDDFLQEAQRLGLVFDEPDLPQLGRYLALLIDANARFNLTAVDEPGAAWRRHILDSLTLLPVIHESVQGVDGQALRLIDVGSGGGLPGLPLAIVLPDVQVTLLEPTGKKAAFLRETAATLGLTNVTVLSDRAEKVGRDKARHREKYDVVTSRAVGALPMLIELMAPLARPGGLVLAIKGAKADEELALASYAIGLLGTRHAGTVETPTGRIIVMEKASRTPNLYPRGDGEPKRAPIKAPQLAGKQAGKQAEKQPPAPQPTPELTPEEGS
jgi:16S rRNA (guanine527-N7)-methyltransferase